MKPPLDHYDSVSGLAGNGSRWMTCLPTYSGGSRSQLVLKSALEGVDCGSKATFSEPKESIRPSLVVGMNPGTTISTHILSGWKDIANYLGKGVRTVQRYEEEFRLPVRRPAGRSRGSVVATKAELDAWIAASPVRQQLQMAIKAGPPSSLAGIRQNLREMRILREQMRDLRSGINRSVCLVQASVVELQGRVQEKKSAASFFSGMLPVGGTDDFASPKAS